MLQDTVAFFEFIDGTERVTAATGRVEDVIAFRSDTTDEP